MFEILPLAAASTVRIEIGGTLHLVPDHFNVAAAMLLVGLSACRTSSVSGAERGPFCMMGVCFDCLVEVDGVPNQQGCMVQVREGMRVSPMQGKARIA